MMASRPSHWITQSSEAAGAHMHHGQSSSTSRADDGTATAYPPRSPAQVTGSAAAAAHPQLLPNVHASSATVLPDSYSATPPATTHATHHPLPYEGERFLGTAGAQGADTWQHEGAQSSSWVSPSRLDQHKGDGGPGRDHQRGRTTTSRTQQIFGTAQVGVIGRHKPRDMIRLDRDYTAGEVCQFWSGYPFELEGRITATEHLNVMNELNGILASAFDPRKSIFDNVTATLTLYLSTWLLSSHYDREIARFDRVLEEANARLYNPAGLNLLNPRKNSFLFLELEYY